MVGWWEPLSRPPRESLASAWVDSRLGVAGDATCRLLEELRWWDLEGASMGFVPLWLRVSVVRVSAVDRNSISIPAPGLVFWHGCRPLFAFSGAVVSGTVSRGSASCYTRALVHTDTRFFSLVRVYIPSRGRHCAPAFAGAPGDVRATRAISRVMGCTPGGHPSLLPPASHRLVCIGNGLI